MDYMVYLVPVAIILICWLIARNIVITDQLKDLESRVKLYPKCSGRYALL